MKENMSIEELYRYIDTLKLKIEVLQSNTLEYIKIIEEKDQYIKNLEKEYNSLKLKYNTYLDVNYKQYCLKDFI